MYDGAMATLCMHVYKYDKCRNAAAKPEAQVVGCLQGTVEVVQRGSIKNIGVSMEDRQGGRKHITRLVHVESFALNPGTSPTLDTH